MCKSMSKEKVLNENINPKLMSEDLHMDTDLITVHTDFLEGVDSNENVPHVGVDLVRLVAATQVLHDHLLQVQEAGLVLVRRTTERS